MQFDLILFDADGTLLDFDRSEEESLRTMLKAMDIPCTPELVQSYQRINLALWKQLERGEVTKAELQQRRFSELFARFTLKADGAEANRRYLDALSQSGFLVEGAEAVCRKLAERVPLYIVTNGIGATQRGRMEKSGIADCFQTLFISEEIGVPKPYKEYFDAVFAEIGDVDRRRVLLVGDSLTSDMQGGENAGVCTCWYNPSGEPRPQTPSIDFEIRSLEELLIFFDGKSLPASGSNA